MSGLDRFLLFLLRKKRIAGDDTEYFNRPFFGNYEQFLRFELSYTFLTILAHCISLVDEELHWIIVVCLERGEEYLVERMQALKLAKKFMTTAGER